MAKQDFHLAYATDENYLDYVAVALGSALIWVSDVSRIVIDVLTLGIDDRTWAEWHASVIRNLPAGSRIVQHRIDAKRFVGLRQWHGSMAAYARLLLPEILEDVAWCAYADVDTLFTDDPLKLETVFDRRYAIMGRQENTMKALDDESRWFTERGYPFSKDKYFCSGFVLMNLDMFRKKNYGEKCIAFLQRYPDAKLVDQDALNAVCFDDVKALPLEWGTFGCEAFGNGRPHAIHCPGHNPWRFLEAMFPDYIDAYNIWFQYARHIYGKRWTDYIRSSPRAGKYVRMRVLGGIFTTLRYIGGALHMLCVPVVGRYLRRHYASYRVWQEITACMRTK